ncbi:MAG: hypothetical protein CPSOU_1144 [uncultured Paraburkholderia sp.]|nr:MAG: hypothetical protein CPSOU_1144 [uncultured Paraburkholderia sp.]
MHEGDRALAGRIGDPFERGFDERAARGASRGEVGGKLGKRRKGVNSVAMMSFDPD